MTTEKAVGAFSEDELRDAAGNEMAVDDLFERQSLTVTNSQTLYGEQAEEVLASTDSMKVPTKAKDTEVTDVLVDAEGSVPSPESKPLTHDEQVEELEYAIRRQPAHREIYLRILKACAQPQILADLEQRIATWPEFKSATIDQYLMICTLENHGGLLRREMTDNGLEVTGEMKEGLDEDALDDLVAYWTFQTTPLGEEVAQKNSPSKRIHELLSAVSARKQAYLDILNFCDESPRAYREIEQLLADRDVLWLGRESKQQPLQPSFFVDKLERAGAIVWDSGWHVTNAGKAILKEVVG